MPPQNSPAPESQVSRNVDIHDKIAQSYDGHHHEIFNDREQARLVASLGAAVTAVRSTDGVPHALDFGCGSGNLTRHLLAHGCTVTAADVSPRFLNLVEERFGADRIATSRLNGQNLGQFADRSFDLIATYSVLHHIPDYLGSVAEMGRICKIGGIVYIDHEATEESWRPNPLYAEFKRKAERTDWSKFLRPINYYGKLRRLFDPRYTNEGDIHVFADDHIEWTRICQTLGDAFEVALDSSYLLYSSLYDKAVFDTYRDRLTDTRVMAFRRVR